MRNLFLGNVMLVGAILVGYSLAYPIRLANYFYDKPQIDIFIYLLLFVSVIGLIQKFLSKYSGLKYAVFLLIAIPLAWLKLDYALYSWLNSPQFVTYIFIILLGISAYALTKFPFTERPVKWLNLVLIPFAAIGFLISIFSQTYDLSQFLVLFFSLGLAAAFWDAKKIVPISLVLITFVLAIVDSRFESPTYFERQTRYHDKVVFSTETDFQKVDITTWKGNYWYYTDQINQFSSIDSWLYYEPFAYPAYVLTDQDPRVLVVGGENGMLMSKLNALELEVDLLPIDLELYELGRHEQLFIMQNNGSLTADYHLIEGEVFDYLDQTNEIYDLVFIDVADPVDLERNQYFTLEFYKLIAQRLSDDGLIVTQSGSPYFATEAFQVVQETLKTAGFQTVAFHNQVLTLGEWSWTLGTKAHTSSELKSKLESADFEAFNTRWLNQEAMQMMLNFGKPSRVLGQVEVNSIAHPVLYKLYLQGNYEFDR